MSVDDDRRELFDLLEASLGSRGAALLMNHLPPVGWADLATREDVHALGSELRGEMAELRGELRGETALLRGEMAELRGEMRGEIALLRGEMAEVRGELRSQLPRLVAANVASAVATAGLVLAAASFA